MLKRILAAVLLVALLSPLCGCLDPQALDKYGYVMSIGVDAGAQKRYRVTFLIQKEALQSGQESSGGATIVGAEGDNIYDAIRVVTEGVAYVLNFSRVNYFVFSEAIARSGLAEDFLGLSASELKLRYSVNVMVTAGTAESFLANTGSAMEPNIAKLQYSLVEMEKKLGIVPALTLMQLFEAAEQGRYDAIMPFGQVDESIVTDKERQTAAEEGEYPISREADTTGGDIRIGGMRVAVIGTALFSGWRMVGVLDAEDTMMLLMARGDFEHGQLTYSDAEGHIVTVDLDRLGEPETTVTLEGEPHVEIRVRLACSVEQDSGAPADERSPQIISELGEYIAGNMERLFYSCRDMGSDAFGVGRAASMQFLTVEAYEAYDWREAYSRMTGGFTVDTELINELGRND